LFGYFAGTARAGKSREGISACFHSEWTGNVFRILLLAPTWPPKRSHNSFKMPRLRPRPDRGARASMRIGCPVFVES
jgi:hypothetical protein